MNKPLLEEIGAPAMLEQTAEECCELGKACLKLARIMRDENKAYISYVDALDNLTEEIADVKLCIENISGPADEVERGKAIVDEKKIWKEYTRKVQRMIDRLYALHANKEV